MLTPEQEALLPIYREKWKAITFSTDPIDPHRARAAVEAGYAAVGKEKPLIIFCPSPFAATKHLIHIQVENQFGGYLSELRNLYFDPYFPEMFSSNKLINGSALNNHELFTQGCILPNFIWEKIRCILLAGKAELVKKSCKEEFKVLNRLIENGYPLPLPLNFVGNYTSGKWELWSGGVDFSISVLNVDYDSKKWAVIQSLINECGWIFPFEKIAIVCGRPTKISLNSNNFLHSEGEPAVIFADGYSMYFYQKDSDDGYNSSQGIGMPPHYDKVPTLINISRKQAELVPHYIAKWGKNKFSTQRINRQEVDKSVKAAYALLSKNEHEVLFCDSPIGIFETVIRYGFSKDLFPEIWEELCFKNCFPERSITQRWSEIFTQIRSQISREERSRIDHIFTPLADESIDRMYDLCWNELTEQQRWKVWSQLLEEIPSEPRKFSYNQEISWHILMRNMLSYQQDKNFFYYFNYDYFSELKIVEEATYIDYCISVLGCICNREEWEIYKSIAKNCWLIICLKNICIVCDRPIKITLDNQQRFHALGEPAIQFADGYSLYYYHGVKLPEEYGKLHPQQWQAEWILKEMNAEIRRVLITEIGYARICQELQANELDVWQEYNLLKIDVSFETEPIYLLKMTCPSTGFIHALRVPPDIATAREAIRWVNGGVDPEEFSVQT